MSRLKPEAQIRGPKYRRIAEAMRASIRTGDYPPGHRLPPESGLAERFDVSVPTVRQALAVLRAEGLLQSRHGVGTFVRQVRRLQRRSRERYGASRGRQGLLNNSLRHEITFAGQTPAPDEIAERLGIEPGTPVVLRRRTLHSRDNGEIEELGASWMLVDVAGGTYLEEPKVVPQALFRCVEELTGRKYAEATDRWVARLPTAAEATAFRLATGAPVLHVVHTARDTEGEILEISESVWPADRIEIIDDYGIPSEATVSQGSDI
jgi:DNA-binding GntR family transcriptional regulator